MITKFTCPCGATKQIKTRKKKELKEFFWKDLSGRGFSNTWNMTELKKAMAGERSDDDEAASTWAMTAEVGDEWNNAANKITRIK